MNKERLAGVERMVVERRLLEHAPRWLAIYAERFSKPSFSEAILSDSRELTEREQEIFRLVSKAAVDVVRKYGGNELNITYQHTVIVPEDSSILHLSEDGGEYSPKDQNFLIKEPISGLEFAISVFHELMHFLSYQAEQVTLEKTPHTSTYHAGFVLRDRTGTKEYFSNLDEAIVEMLTKRFLNTAVETLDSGLRQEKENIQDVEGRPAFKDIERDEVVTAVKDEISKALTIAVLGYKDERAALQVLIDKLYKANPERFSNPDEVFDLFAGSIFTGHILEVARLIERTFGIGTFRRLGELDQDVEALKAYVESL